MAQVQRVILVSDEAIVAAQRGPWDVIRIVAEPGAAAPLAALIGACAREAQRPLERRAGPRAAVDLGTDPCRWGKARGGTCKRALMRPQREEARPSCCVIGRGSPRSF